MTIVILALDGVFDTGLAAFQDTLATAVDLAPPDQRALFETQVVSLRHGTCTAHGLGVPGVRPASAAHPDIVLVPALGAKSEHSLAAALGAPDVASAGEELRAWHDQGAMICAACTGSFVLAEAGLLNGVTATTSWWLGAFFRSRYPTVRLNSDRALVCSNRLITAGAVLAHFDLALWLIRQRSPALADTVARYLMLDPRSSQAAYAIPDHVRHEDPTVRGFERWCKENLRTGFMLDAAADSVGVSKRTLARRVATVLGQTPLAYFQDMRVDQAAHLLRTTKLSVDEIAWRTGYGDAATLRTLLRRRLGRTASEIRRIDRLRQASDDEASGSEASA